MFILMTSMDLSSSKLLLFKDHQPANMDEEGHYVFEMKKAQTDVPTARYAI